MELEKAWLLVLDAHACIPTPPRESGAADAQWEKLIAMTGAALARALSGDRRLIAQLLDRDAEVGPTPGDAISTRRILLRLTMLAARYRQGAGPAAPRGQIMMSTGKCTTTWRSRTEKLTVSMSGVQ